MRWIPYQGRTKIQINKPRKCQKKISRLSLYSILFSGGIFSRCPVRLKTFLESNDGRNYPSQFHLSAISEPTLNSDFYGATRFLLRNNPCTVSSFFALLEFPFRNHCNAITFKGQRTAGPVGWINFAWSCSWSLFWHLRLSIWDVLETRLWTLTSFRDGESVRRFCSFSFFFHQKGNKSECNVC